MKKHIMLTLLALTMTAAAVGCGKKEEASADITEEFSTEEEVVAGEEAPAEEEKEPQVEVVPEGMYRSELTNEIISEELKDQRPLAVMVDNELTALPHFGLTQADIVYEIMNSTKNDEITRFMALIKDYDQITQFGSIRSIRPTNFYLGAEWNAIFCHDGGPEIYVTPFYGKDYVDHFNGVFSRVDNGKPREFTEYICEGEMDKHFSNNSRISREYNEFAPTEPHFQFTDSLNPVEFQGHQEYFDCTYIDLPFKHNGSELEYDEESKTYLYSEYGDPHLDPANDNKQLAFKNVILQRMTYSQLDAQGYLIWNCIGAGERGYYITEGQAIPITWSKTGETERTIYYDMFGDEIVLNTGKTYIGFVADTRWDQLVVK